MITWTYLAGFFDGEGNICCSYTGQKYIGGLRASVCQSQMRGKILLEEIQAFLSAQGIASRLAEAKRKQNEKRFFILTLCARSSVVMFLSGVFPYLHIKKVEAQDAMRFLKIFPTTTRHTRARLSWESSNRRERAAAISRGLRRHYATHVAPRQSEANKAKISSGLRLAWHDGKRTLKLTEAAVRKIRSTDFTKRGAQARLAREFGVSKTNIVAVALRKTWAHVDEGPSVGAPEVVIQ